MLREKGLACLLVIIDTAAVLLLLMASLTQPP